MTFDPLGLADAIPDAAAFERQTLAALERSVGFDAAFFATAGAPPTTVGLDATKLERALVRHAYDHEILPLKQAALAGRGVAVDTDILGEEGVARTGYHRDLAAPVRGRHSLLAFLVLRGRPLGTVMLGRTGRTFSEREVGAVASLLGPLAFARASYHAPWRGRRLPEPPEQPLAARALAWARGERTLAIVDDAEEGRIVVRDRAGYREMAAFHDGAVLVWSRADLQEARRSGWFYVELFHLAASRARNRGRALFLGAGGGVGLRQFAEVYPGIALDLVDIDPRVIELAHEWYGLGTIPNLTVHVADAFDFVASAPAACWDIVIADTYAGVDLPARLLSRSFFHNLSRVLRPGGALAVNTIGPLEAPSPVRLVERLAGAELRDVRLVPVLDQGEDFARGAVRNVIVLASR
jgi:SAM-dependent methyltransferase